MLRIAHRVTFMNSADTDNWFMTVQGGSNILLVKDNIHAELKNRFWWQRRLYFGKWVTPTFGFRFGGQYLMTKGATQYWGMFRGRTSPLSLTATIPRRCRLCLPSSMFSSTLLTGGVGYRPGRVYNAVLHGGKWWKFTFRRAYDGADLRWRSAKHSALSSST